MNPAKRVFRNSGASLLAQISTPATSFVLVFFIARLLGVSGMGKYSSALSLFYIFQAFSSLGFSYLITREVAQDKSKAGKYLINAAFLVSIFAIPVIIAMCLVINLITDVPGIINATYVLSFALIPYSLTIVGQAICAAFEKIEYNTISSITGNIFKVCLGLLVLFRGYGLMALMVVILIGYSITFCLNFYFALKCIPDKHFRVDYKLCKWIIGATPVFAFILIANTIRWNVDNLIITNMLGAVEVGFYSAAYKLLNISKLGLNGYIIAIQPVIFRLFKSSLEKYKSVCEDSIRFLLIICMPIAVGTTLLSDRLIILIYGVDFLPAAQVLRLIIWIMVFSGANLIFANALVASNHQKVNLQGVVMAMLINIGLNLWLIPRIGFIGAAIASISSSLALISYQYFFVSKYLFKVNYFKLALKPVISAAVMGILILQLKNANLFVIIFVALAGYILSLFALKTFSAKDKALFLKLLKKDSDFAVQ